MFEKSSVYWTIWLIRETRKGEINPREIILGPANNMYNQVSRCNIREGMGDDAIR